MSKDLYLEAIKWIKEYLPHRQETTKIVCDYVVSLEQQNTALQQERSNMQSTHQSTIKSYQQDILALQARIKDLEEEYSKQEYRFSCVLDNATGGKASKTNIDLDIAYKLISDNVNFWVNSAVEEIEKEYQEFGE